MPDRLRSFVRPRVVAGVVLLVVAAASAVSTFLLSLEPRRFEARAPATEGVVVRLHEENWERLDVRFEVDGNEFEAAAPVFDNQAYEPGERVLLWYDPERPSERVRLVDEPYDASFGWFGAAILALLAALLLVRGIFWPRRLRRVVAQDHGYVMLAGRASSWRKRRLHIALYAMDAQPGDLPVIVVPLLDGQEWELPGEGAEVRVRGRVRHGGVVVVDGRSGHLWPRSRAIAGSRLVPRVRWPAHPPGQQVPRTGSVEAGPGVG